MMGNSLVPEERRVALPEPTREEGVLSPTRDITSTTGSIYIQVVTSQEKLPRPHLDYDSLRSSSLSRVKNGPLRNQPGRGSWSFGGRTWKPRASDHFAARPWGIEMMEVEAGAAIYRNKRAEGAPYAHPPAPAGGRGLPHPLRGAGTGRPVPFLPCTRNENSYRIPYYKCPRGLNR